MNTETTAAVAFDDVKAGDVLQYVHIVRGFMPDVRTVTETVERVTANTVFLTDGSRLARATWYEKDVRRVAA